VFLTADSILLLLVLGPTDSRTFINALYFFMRQFTHNSASFKVKLIYSLASIEEGIAASKSPHSNLAIFFLCPSK
jgi:hypothetical protein